CKMVGRGPGYSSLTVERAVDLFVVSVMASISILVGLDLLPRGFYIYGVLIMSAIFVAAANLVVRKIEVRGKLGDYLRHFKVCFGDVKAIFVVVLLSILSWSVVAIGWQLSLLSISMDIGFQNSIALMSLTTIVNVLSLIPGGIGVSEASISELLTRLDYSTIS